MKTLSHIECPRASYKGDYFVTITLPPRHHRKGPRKQKDILDAYIKFIGNNYFEHAVGVYEFTKKGVLHAHLVVDMKDYFEGLKFESDRARQEANITILCSALNQFSINDVQVIKSMDWIYTYFHKHIKITERILNSSVHIWFRDNINIKALQVEELEHISQERLHVMFKDFDTEPLDEEIREFSA